MNRFESKIWVYRGRTIAEQQRKMVHFAGLAAFKNKPAMRPRSFANQMMMDGRDREQSRDRHPIFAHLAVRQDQNIVPIVDRLARKMAQTVKGPLEALCSVLAVK